MARGDRTTRTTASAVARVAVAAVASTAATANARAPLTYRPPNGDAGASVGSTAPATLLRSVAMAVPHVLPAPAPVPDLPAVSTAARHGDPPRWLRPTPARSLPSDPPDAWRRTEEPPISLIAGPSPAPVPGEVPGDPTGVALAVLSGGGAPPAARPTFPTPVANVPIAPGGAAPISFAPVLPIETVTNPMNPIVFVGSPITLSPLPVVVTTGGLPVNASVPEPMGLTPLVLSRLLLPRRCRRPVGGRAA